MLRGLLSLVVLLGFIQAPHPYTILPGNTDPVNNLYLPLVVNVYPIIPPVGIFVLGEADYVGYPGDYCIFGYVTSHTQTAVYSVTLAIEVNVHPYCEPESDVCPQPYSETHYVNPELEATLPDQVNPFSYCLMYTKSSYGYGAVELSSYDLNPPNGRVSYPLTVTSWTKQGTDWETTVSGTVRNDSGHRLIGIRVVGIAGICSAKEANLPSTILQPGEETSFIFYKFMCPWINPFVPSPEMVEISAQGVAEP